MNIVLLEPEIPQNTGNIARTCAATGTVLHLIRPLGFEISDKYMKRAGLDYWSRCDVRLYDDLPDFLRRNPGGECFYASTKAGVRYDAVRYPPDAYLFFGSETRGLPEDLLRENYERAVRIPMAEGIRSLNLSNSAAVVLYEALRQHGFSGLETAGRLKGTRREEEK